MKNLSFIGYGVTWFTFDPEIRSLLGDFSKAKVKTFPGSPRLFLRLHSLSLVHKETSNEFQYNNGETLDPRVLCSMM